MVVTGQTSINVGSRFGEGIIVLCVVEKGQFNYGGTACLSIPDVGDLVGRSRVHFPEGATPACVSLDRS